MTESYIPFTQEMKKTHTILVPNMLPTHFRLIMQVLDGYALSDDAKIHWQRVLRATMHGFCVHEHMGGFSHSPLPVSDSYHMAIRCIAEGLEKAELKR